MAAKQNSLNKKKEGEITRSERTSATEQAASALRRAKEQAGNVIHIVIDNRTTMEFPAHLSKEEIDARIERYLKRNEPES